MTKLLEKAPLKVPRGDRPQAPRRVELPRWVNPFHFGEWHVSEYG
jgi:hypothetical protein